MKSKKIFTIVVVALFALAVATHAKSWKKKGDAYEVIAAAGSSGVAERMIYEIASSMCLALDETFFEEVDRAEKPIKSHINGTLVTNWEMVLTVKFHSQPVGNASPCDRMADEKKVKKFRKQLSKGT